MKITTWNVNGLRAVLNKGAWEWVREYSPDLICLQEIKARQDQLSEEHIGFLDEYQQYWNPAERPGYSGVLTMAPKEIPAVRYGLGKEKFDGEGRVIKSALNNVEVFNVYIPNGKRDLSRVAYKLEFYAELLSQIKAIQKEGGEVIVCGDFNTAHQEIDLKNHKQNQKTTGFLPEEREWVQKFLDAGMLDPFRVLYPDREQYSWWSFMGNARANNVGWRLDYFLITKSLMDRVGDVIIHDDVYGSDHCPVTLDIDI